MFHGFLPVFLFIVVATLVPVGMLAAAYALSPRRRGAVKEMPYESGVDPIHDTRRRFSVQFHLVAIAFLVFDVELLFLYPWAVAARAAEGGIDEAVQAGHVDCRLLVFAGAMAFTLLLVLGFAYDWRKGLFKWR
jgi:NADH-quinone oxidoreductase subunit A